MTESDRETDREGLNVAHPRRIIRATQCHRFVVEVVAVVVVDAAEDVAAVAVVAVAELVNTTPVRLRQ